MVDLIGLSDQRESLSAYFSGNIPAQAALLSGPLGTGKSSLTEELAAEWGLTIYHPTEPKSVRGKRSKQAKPTHLRKSIRGGQRLLVAEDPSVSFIRNLLKQPELVVIIVTEAWRIPRDIRNRCHQVVFKRPKRLHYRSYLGDRHDVSDDVLSQFQNWRDLRNWMEGGDPTGSVILSEFEQATKIFASEHRSNQSQIQSTSISTESLLHYYILSEGDRVVVERVNMLLSWGEFGKRVARDLLMLQHIKVKFPYGKKGEKKQAVKFLGFV